MKKFVWSLVVLVTLLAGTFFVTYQRGSGEGNPFDYLKKSVIGGDCESNTQPLFTHYPTDIELVTLIEPPFMEIGGNLKGHSYISVTDRAPVYAPSDAVLVEGAKYRENHSGRGSLDQYLLHFDVSCEVYYFFDHVINPPQKIAQAFPGSPKDTTETSSTGDIEVKAGEFIGYSVGQGEHNFDFGVVNRSQNSPLSEDEIPFKSDKYTHADCPYDYFTSDKKARLFELIGYSGAADLKVIDNLCD